MLSVKAMGRCDCEKLDEAGRLSEPPLILFYGPGSYRHAEGAE